VPAARIKNPSYPIRKTFLLLVLWIIGDRGTRLFCAARESRPKVPRLTFVSAIDFVTSWA
jgi:hypothetical protein